MTVVVLPVGLTYVVDEAGAAVVTVAGAGFWTVRSFLYSHAAVAAASTNAKTKRCMTFSLPSGAAPSDAAIDRPVPIRTTRRVSCGLIPFGGRDVFPPDQLTASLGCPGSTTFQCVGRAPRPAWLTLALLHGAQACSGAGQCRRYPNQ